MVITPKFKRELYNYVRWLLIIWTYHVPEPNFPHTSREGWYASEENPSLQWQEVTLLQNNGTTFQIPCSTGPLPHWNSPESLHRYAHLAVRSSKICLTSKLQPILFANSMPQNWKLVYSAFWAGFFTDSDSLPFRQSMCCLVAIVSYVFLSSIVSSILDGYFV